MWSHSSRIILGAAVVCLAGCGPKVVVYDVTGTVTYNGKPPDDVGCSITFVAADGKDVTAPIAPSGQFEAKGVVSGPNTVAVFYRNPAAAESLPPGQKPPKSTSPLRKLPLKYADPKTSQLKVDVGPGTVFNVDMKGPPLK